MFMNHMTFIRGVKIFFLIFIIKTKEKQFIKNNYAIYNQQLSLSVKLLSKSA